MTWRYKWKDKYFSFLDEEKTGNILLAGTYDTDTNLVYIDIEDKNIAGAYIQMQISNNSQAKVALNVPLGKSISINVYTIYIKKMIILHLLVIKL